MSNKNISYFVHLEQGYIGQISFKLHLGNTLELFIDHGIQHIYAV